MRYVLLIAVDDQSGYQLLPEEEASLMAEYGALNEALDGAGAMRGGERLRPSETATTVRVRDGETLVTDGPFAESKELVGGYSMVEAPDLATAIEYAKTSPMQKSGGLVEVRELANVGSKDG